MEMADETMLTVEEVAARLKCARGWVQLSVDAGCPTDVEGRMSLRDYMMFQLANIHKIRELAGLPVVETSGRDGDLRPNVKAILTSQLEWLQIRSTKESVKKAARLVFEKLNAMDQV